MSSMSERPEATPEGEAFELFPPEGEQERSHESDETLSPDEKSDG